ncbi:hypothetical protein BH24ACI1_BH24ACI1_06350 [soil metagenome]
MRNITNALGALGESLLWNKLHRIKYLISSKTPVFETIFAF